MSERRTRARRVLRKLLRWGALGLLALVLVLAGVLAWVIGTERGSRFAVDQVLTRYSAAVPGAIVVDRVDGPLAGPTCIHGLELRDGSARPLLTIRRTCLDLDLAALTSVTLASSEVRAEGVTVHVYETPTWTDLTPTNALVRSDPLPGPDLRFGVDAGLVASDVSVVDHRERASGSVAMLVADAGIIAEVSGRGRQAHADVHALWGWAADRRVAVAAGRGVIEWHSPTVEVRDLTLVTDSGVATIDHGSFVTNTFDHELEATGTAVAAVEGTPFSIELIGGGDDVGSVARLAVEVPGRGRLDAELAATFRGGVRATVNATGHLDAAPAPVHVLASGVIGSTRPAARVLARAGQTTVRASLRNDEGRALVDAPGASARATVRLDEFQPSQVSGEVVVRNIEELAAELEDAFGVTFEAPSGVTGRVAATCVPEPRWMCSTDGRVVRADDHAAFAVDLWPQMPLVASVSRLSGEVGGQGLGLRHRAGVVASRDLVLVDDLSLDVAGGVARIDGRLAADQPSRLTLVADRIDLGALDRSLLHAGLDGRAHADVEVTGRIDDPRLVASARIENLQYAETPIGFVQATIRAGFDRAAAEVEVAGAQDEYLRAFADVPIVRDDSGLALRPNGRFEASVDLEKLDLTRLAPWLGDEGPTGRVAVSARAAGSLRNPVLAAKASAHRLAVAEVDIGDVELSAMHRDSRLETNVQARVFGGDLVALGEARLDLALDRGVARLDDAGPHTLSIDLADIDLACVRPWIDDRSLSGIVDGRITVGEQDGEANASASLLAHGLALQDRELGAAQVIGKLEPDTLSVAVNASGPHVRAIVAELRASVTTQGLRALPSVPANEPMAARVELTDVDIEAVSRWLESDPASGSIGGTIVAEGTLREPRAQASLVVDRLATIGGSLGHAELEAAYDGRHVRADLVHRKGAQSANLTAEIPVTVDLEHRSFAWHREQPHELRLDARGLDDETLRMFVELPSDMVITTSADAFVHGTLDDPTAGLRLRGTVSSSDAIATAINAEIQLEPDRQSARILLGGGPTGLKVEADSQTRLADVLAGRTKLSDVEVVASASADALALRDLGPLLPNVVYDPRGSLALDASLKGSLAAPEIEGSMELSGGEITVVPLNQRLRAMTMRASFDGPDVTLSQFVASSGEGSLSAAGEFHIAPDDTRGNLRFAARKLPLVRPGLPVMQVDANVDVDLDATGPRTDIAIRARDGFVDVLEVAPVEAAEPLPELTGVEFTDSRDARPGRKDNNDEGREPWIPRDVDLVVELVDPLRIRGSKADMDWDGRVHLRRGGGDPFTEGRFTAKPGGFIELLGNRFEIDRGEVTVPGEGDLDPYVDLAAAADVDGVLVTMGVQGRISRPDLVLSSQPPMEESTLFALLVTGTADDGQADDAELSAKAAGLLAAVNSPALQQQLRSTVGIDSVGVGFGDTVSEPVVSVGKRIGRKLYTSAEYHHNAPEDENDAELKLEYLFSPHWSVETFFGNAAEGGVTLWWRHRFRNVGDRGAAKPARDLAERSEQGKVRHE